jgi:hypothetical protein
VLAQRLHERRGLAVEQREELLLLLAEVPARLVGEEAAEARRRGAPLLLARGRRTPQLARADEGVVVVVRERDEG